MRPCPITVPLHFDAHHACTTASCRPEHVAFHDSPGEGRVAGRSRAARLQLGLRRPAARTSAPLRGYNQMETTGGRYSPGRVPCAETTRPPRRGATTGSIGNSCIERDWSGRSLTDHRRGPNIALSGGGPMCRSNRTEGAGPRAAPTRIARTSFSIVFQQTGPAGASFSRPAHGDPRSW